MIKQKYYCPCGKEIHKSTALYRGGKCRHCGRLGNTIPKNVRDKISKALIGRKRPEMTLIWKNKYDGKRKEKFCEDCGKQIENLNAERCIDCYRIWNRGKNHWNYINGLSKCKYPNKFNKQLKDSIRKRDKYKCQECGSKYSKYSDKQYANLHVHHIDYDKKNCNETNLISLCCSCHVKTNYNRKYWFQRYSRMVKGICKFNSSYSR